MPIYCALSSLPIHNGDKCVLISLGFSLECNFNGNSEPNFAELYDFLAVEPKIVEYTSSYYSIVYDKSVKTQDRKSELYMLLHKGFYDSVMNEYLVGANCELSELNMGKETQLLVKKYKDFQLRKIQVPYWLINLFKLQFFMRNLSKKPYPNDMNVENKVFDAGELFERIRSEIR